VWKRDRDQRQRKTQQVQPIDRCVWKIDQCNKKQATKSNQENPHLELEDCRKGIQSDEENTLLDNIRVVHHGALLHWSTCAERIPKSLNPPKLTQRKER